MVYLPSTLASARALRAGEPFGGLAGFAVTPDLVRALGPDADDEEAGYAALSAAGLVALTSLGAEGTARRLVLAVDVATDQVTAAVGEAGEVRVDRLTWRQVQALFADEDDAAAAVRAAAAEAAGREVPDALSGPAVAALNGTYDLLWYAPDELDALA